MTNFESTNAKRFIRVFGATWGLGLLGMVVFSVYANPWGNFGPTGYHRLYNARAAKAEFLAALPKSELPEVLVLGSSNVMRYKPASITQKLGYSAFNYGVFWGKSEDYLTITKYVIEDLQHTPKLLIIGLDTWTFAPAGNEHPIFPGLRRRLLNAPQLIKHHPDVPTAKRLWANFTDCFSQQQLRESYNLIARGVTRTAYPALDDVSMFEDDGTRVRYANVYGARKDNIFPDVESGAYSIDDQLEAIANSDRPGDFIHLGKYTFKEFRQRRLDYMEDLLMLTDEHDVDVVFLFNPIHPAFHRTLRKVSSHSANMTKLRVAVADWITRHPSAVASVDTAEIVTFGGNKDSFYDEIHPGTANCDLVLEQIKRVVDVP